MDEDKESNELPDSSTKKMIATLLKWRTLCWYEWRYIKTVVYLKTSSLLFQRPFHSFVHLDFFVSIVSYREQPRGSPHDIYLSRPNFVFNFTFLLTPLYSTD